VKGQLFADVLNSQHTGTARRLANKYEDIVNLHGAVTYCGGFPHSLLNRKLLMGTGTSISFSCYLEIVTP